MGQNFSLLIAGQVVAAPATPNQPAVSIDTTGRPDVMIYNPGPGVVHARCGDAGVLVDGTGNPILAGEKSIWSKSGAGHLATYSPSGVQNIVVLVGTGQ